MLLVGAVAFGYLILTGLSLVVAPVAGLAGVSVALLVQLAARRWRSLPMHQSAAASTRMHQSAAASTPGALAPQSVGGAVVGLE
jgi:hypothetical protein